MDSVGTIIFSILFVFVIGFIIYFTIDYLKYKEEIKNKMEQNDVIFGNLLTTDNTITSNLDIVDKSLTKKHNDDSSDLNAFDSALKNYFSFGDNNLSIQNEKLFEHVFSRISPNLELLTHVNTAQGLMVNTNKEVLDSRNMKICNDEKSCIYMNVNDDGFNITPDSVNNLTINSTEKTPLAKFDLENNSIYFGGDDLNSPMFIRDDKVFLNNINMISRPKNTVINHNNINDLKIFSLNGYDITDSLIDKTLSAIDNNKFIVFYNAENSAKRADDTYLYEWKIDFHIISNYDYVTNDVLTFDVPFKLKSGSSNGSSITNTLITENIISSENIEVKNKSNKLNVTITVKNNNPTTSLPSKTFFKFSLSGSGKLETLIQSRLNIESGLLIGEKKPNEISSTPNTNVFAPSLPSDATMADLMSNTTSINTP